MRRLSPRLGRQSLLRGISIGPLSTPTHTRHCSSSSSSASSASSSSGGEAPEARESRKALKYRTMAGDTNYMSWTKNGLLQRVKELEAELRNRPPAAAAPPPPPPKPEAAATPSDASSSTKKPKPKGKRKMDPSKYTTRYIALKLAYLGKNYGGFEFQAMANQPSIEEELWNALTRACLIFPKDERVVDFDCCEYSKCGRTDRGVSAFGQVIGLRVRSNRPIKKSRAAEDMEEEGGEGEGEEEQEKDTFDPIKDELQYPRLLNRILPPDIRVLAWCPSPPPDFSARFSCRERQYRYFFTQPAFSPDPASGGKSGWLDVDAMRAAARLYEGEHDFRNMCKIDPGKQITNFCRVIYEADIVEVADAHAALPYLSEPGFAPPPGIDIDSTAHPKVYSFNVRGSAFLWHQIRHMVSVLFLVGQGLESPQVVSQLLDTATNTRKPNYVMADEVPLVLWDCIFPGDAALPTPPDKKEDALQWLYLADDPAQGKFGMFGVVDGLWAHWRERKLDELLSSQLLQLVSRQGGSDPEWLVDRPQKPDSSSSSVIVYEGGNAGRMGGKYVPLMQKDKLQSAEEQNERYAKRKGFEGSEDMRQKKGFGKRKADEALVADE